MLLGNIDLKTYLIRLFVLFLSISVHEWAHAYSAYRYGDDTAYHMGRVTLNPIRHFEPIGLMLILIGAPIAWAKPVPINPSRFRREVNRSNAMLWVSLSGITCNFILAFTGAGLFYTAQFLFFRGGIAAGTAATLIGVLRDVAVMLMSINVFLAIFNLLPLPQLDGFELFSRILPRQVVWWMQSNARAISMAMLLVIVFLRAPFSRFLMAIASPILRVLQWPWAQLFGLL